MPQPNSAQTDRSPYTAAVLGQILTLPDYKSHQQLYGIVTVVCRVGIVFQTRVAERLSFFRICSTFPTNKLPVLCMPVAQDYKHTPSRDSV